MVKLASHLPEDPVNRRTLPATVIALGLVSFFTDMSSEMIYPLLPVFLTTVLGAGALSLGLIEGVAESTAAFLKLGSGIFADRWQRRKPFLLAGYGLAGLMRPLIGLAAAWPLVLLLRFMDRVGKGLRTAPRDALITDAVPAEIRGRAFGFHRSMDHAGAVAGPLLAAGLLTLPGVGLRQVFLLALVPALVVMGIIVFGVREASRPENGVQAPPPFRLHWGELGGDFKMILLALLVFTLGNSSDAFFMLRLGQAMQEKGWDTAAVAGGVAGLWSLHHVVKMICTYFGGRWSDHWGRRPMIVTGWLIYAGIYAAFAWIQSPGALVVLFLMYGIYFGLTEPVEKAWVADLAPAHLRGTAFGYYNGVMGLGALPASALFGWLWASYGPASAYLTGAGLALGASLILLAAGTRRRVSPA